MNVCIIGGGMMGLAIAYHLSKTGINVVVLEKDKEVGGLSRSAEVAPGLRWDRFYHVILSTDTDLLNFLDEIGLSLSIKFKATKTGFYTDGRLHSMSNIMEFLTFRPLSFFNKIRLGIGILFASRIEKGDRLGKVYAKNWLIKVFGRRNYEKMWDPLLRSKLGSASSKASGTFIWTIIKRYYSTRHKGSKEELLGCVEGGYHSILQKIKEKLEEKGVVILPEHTARKIIPEPNGQLRIVVNKNEEKIFDKVVVTLPNPNIVPLLPSGTNGLKSKLHQIDYLNLTCAVLVLKDSLSPYYVTNITDPGFPFTGIIEATNVLPTEDLKGHALVYLPRWMPKDDPFIKLKEEEILNQFIEGLRKIFPSFKNEKVLYANVHREFNVQPVQAVGYEKNIPSMNTGIEGLYLMNTSMIKNSTLNNNQVIKLARKAAEKIVQEN